MTTPSTPTSRNLVLRERTHITRILVRNVEPYAVEPPVTLAAGTYRAELDPVTRTATITEDAT